MYPKNPDRNASTIIGIDWIIIAVTNRIMNHKKNINAIAFIRVFLGLSEGIYTQDKKHEYES